ncbi:MAG: DUF3500 domain-containing protein [Betaproteobacteria bacterium]|nr:DUF3500 domain-containing protein [Betaproteobacteria bacterium]
MRLFEPEEAKGFAVMQSLTSEKCTQATIGMEIPFDTFSACFTDNYRQARKGVRHADMSSAQQALLMDLVELYVGRMRANHAAVKMAEVR